MSNESFTSDPSSAPALWASLETIVSSRVYEPKTPLFQCGQPAAGIYLIRQGRVRLWMSEPPSKTFLADTAGAGTMLGLSETIAHCAHKVSAVASTSTEVGFVSSDTLIGFLGDHHDVCLQVVRILSEDLHFLYHHFQNLRELRYDRADGKPDCALRSNLFARTIRR